MTRPSEWWRILAARCRALLQPQRVHQEIDDELQFHMEMRAQEHMRSGVPESEARRRAALAFGHVGGIKEHSYDIRGGGAVESRARDVGYAWRAIRNQRTLSAVVIGVVAIGIA